MPGDSTFREGAYEKSSRDSSCPYSFTFVSSCQNHSKLFLPVLNMLERRGHGVSLVSLDRYYAESASESVRDFGYEVLELPGHFCRGRYFECVSQQGLFELEAAQEIRRLFLETSPECVVLAHDQSAIESLFVRAAESVGACTVRLQHGFQGAWRLDPSRRKQEFCPGDSGLDLECVWGEALAAQLRARGSGAKIVVSGNPRTDVLRDWKGPRTPSAPFDVLVAAQNFAKHGRMTFEDELKAYEGIIRDLLRRDDVRVLLRLHPQQTRVEEYRELSEKLGYRVMLDGVDDSLDALRRVDLLVTINSTISAEAALMGVPVAYLDNCFFSSPPKAERRRREFLEAIEGDDFPRGIAIGVESLEKHAENWYRSVDGRATERVVEALEAAVCGSKQWRRRSLDCVHASVILDMAYGDSLDSLRSLLRSCDFQYEVILVDRSTDGSVSEFVESEIEDKRLVLVRAPGAGSADAFVLGAGVAKGEVVLRLHSGCVAMPGWVEAVHGKFAKYPNVELLLSHIARRDEHGIVREIIALPDLTSSEALLEDASDGLSIYGYGFRKASVALLGECRRSGRSFDQEFALAILRNREGRDGVCIAAPPFVTTPFHFECLGRALKPPLCVTPKGALTAPKMSVCLHGVSTADMAVDILSALHRQSLSRKRFEIVFLNDGGGESVREKVRMLFSEGSDLYLENAFSLPVAQARHAMIEYSNGDILLFLDGSCVPKESFLEAHYRVHAESTKGYLCSFGPEPSGESSPGGEGEYGFDEVRADNLCIPSYAFDKLKLRFDVELTSEWARVVCMAFRLWHEGYRFYFAPEAVFSRRSAAADEEGGVSAKRELATDVVRIWQIHPELRPAIGALSGLGDEELLGLLKGF